MAISTLYCSESQRRFFESFDAFTINQLKLKTVFAAVKTITFEDEIFNAGKGLQIGTSIKENNKFAVIDVIEDQGTLLITKTSLANLNRTLSVREMIVNITFLNKSVKI